MRPDPSSPPIPRISPRRRSKLTPCSTRRQPRLADRVEREIAHREHRRARGCHALAVGEDEVAADHRRDDRVRAKAPSIGAVSTRRPSRSTVTLSASSMTSSMRCEVKMIATPAAASWRTTLNSVSHSVVDSAEVGSSIIRMRASSDSALAISTSCCSPTLSSATRLCGSMSMPSRRKSAVRRLRDPPPIDDGPGDQRLASEEDIVGRGQFGNEIELLMNDRDARPLGVLHAREPDRRARQPNGAVVFDMHPGDDLHQRRSCRRRSRQSAHALRRSSNQSRRRAAHRPRRTIWRRLSLRGRRGGLGSGLRGWGWAARAIRRTKPPGHELQRRASSCP